MPYSGPSDDKLPQNVKDAPADLRDAWVKAFNAAYRQYDGDEARAFATANAVLKRARARECYAYTPTDNPSDWQLPVWESADAGGPDAKLLGRACAALSPGGLAGVRAQIPECDLPFVKARIASEYRTLGAPVPVWAQTDEPASRVGVAEIAEVLEAEPGAAPNVWTIRAIRPGINTRGTRNYTPRALRESFPEAFREVKMYSRHPRNDADLRERAASVGRDLVGIFHFRSNEADGSPVGRATIIDDNFQSKLMRLREAGLMHQIGVSIHAIAEGVKTKVRDSVVHIVERFIPSHHNSIDFVSSPGAGGEIVLEAEIPETDVDLVSECTLRERRPELVEAIANHAADQAKKEIKKMEEVQALKDEITGLKATIKTVEAERDGLKAELDEAKGQIARAKVQEAVAAALANANLPEDVVKDGSELRQQLSKVETVEAAENLILKAQVTAMKAAKPEPTAEKAKVRGMGRAQVPARESLANQSDAVREAYVTHGMRIKGLNRADAEARADRLMK